MTTPAEQAPSTGVIGAPLADSSAPAHAPRVLHAWRNAIFAVFFLGGLSIASWVARVPAMRDDLGLSTGEVGFVIFGLSAGSILGLVISAPLMNRIGARRGMVASITTIALGLLLLGIGTALLGAVPVAAAGLALVGLGMGSVDVMMNVEGAAVERQIGKTLMPLMHAFFSFGTMAGAGIAAVASALNVSMFAHLTAISIALIVAVIIAVRFVPLSEGVPVSTETGSIIAHMPLRKRLARSLAVWRDGRLLLIGVVMLGMSFAEGGANDWLALAVVDGHGFDNTTGALIFGVFVTTMTAARVLGGPVLDRFGRVPVLRVCALLGIAGLTLFIFASVTWLLILGTIMWGAGCALGFPVGMSAAADDTKNAAARVSAVAVIGYCAFLVGPPVIGLLGEHFGILNALLLILALMVLAGLAAPAAREQHGPRARTPQAA